MTNIAIISPPELTGKNNKPVGNWKMLSVRLFAGGMDMGDIASEFGVSEDEVSMWLTSGEGRRLVVEAVGQSKASAQRLLDGQRVSNILKLIRLRDAAKTEAVQLNAASQLQKMIDSGEVELPKSPEELKATLEKQISQLAQFKSQQ